MIYSISVIYIQSTNPPKRTMALANRTPPQEITAARPATNHRTARAKGVGPNRQKAWNQGHPPTRNFKLSMIASKKGNCVSRAKDKRNSTGHNTPLPKRSKTQKSPAPPTTASKPQAPTKTLPPWPITKLTPATSLYLCPPYVCTSSSQSQCWRQTFVPTSNNIGPLKANKW